MTSPTEFNFVKFMSALQKALDSIGHANGHKLNDVDISADIDEGTSNEQRDQMFNLRHSLHEYHVTTVAESYFKSKREKAKTRLLLMLADLGYNKETAKVKPGNEGVIFESSTAALLLKVNKPAEVIDPNLMIINLRIQGVDKEKIDKAIIKATVTREPAKAWRVVAPTS